MAKVTPESKVRNPVIKYAHSLGIDTIRMYFGPGVQTSWPDDLILVPGGRALFIEFKAKGKKPTKKQYHKMKRLDDAGYLVEWTDNVEEGKSLIDQAIEINKE